MTIDRLSNPFTLGDRVRFVPDEHVIGWSYSSFDRLRLNPGDEGIVTRIQDGSYLWLDDERGGFHWQCFERSNVVMEKAEPKSYLSAKASRAEAGALTAEEIEAAEAEAEAWARRVNCC